MASDFIFDLRVHDNQGAEDKSLTIPNWKDNAFNNAVEYAARSDRPKFDLMVVIGYDDFGYVGNLQWSIHLKKLKIDHQLVVVPKGKHGLDWKLDNTDERIYRFIANGLRRIPKQ